MFSRKWEYVKTLLGCDIVYSGRQVNIGSKKPPAYIYRAVGCGLFNDVTATAQIQKSRERPSGVHGRLSGLPGLDIP
jgi:hypothetical protein